MAKEVLNAQRQHWEKNFSERPEMFGAEPSFSALRAAEVFHKEGRSKLLELGPGQGRDTIFLAQSGFQIQVLDYCESGIEAITNKAAQLSLSQSIVAKCHDICQPLPFDAETFDGCYSHMLYCMALTTPELEFLSKEIWRVLKRGGLNVYTARHTGDPHYGTGTHRGEEMYEVGGFIVHFFSKQKVEHLAKGYEIVSLDEFEEGRLPRKLFLVVLRKQ